MTPLEQIEADVMRLPTEEQLELAYHILDRVSGGFDSPQIENAWIEEAQRRWDAIQSGEAKTVPLEEVMAKLNAVIGE